MVLADNQCHWGASEKGKAHQWGGLVYLARAPVVSCVQLLQRRGLLPSRLLCPWDYPGKNSAVGCHFLLQGIFPIQGSNLCLLHLLRWQADTLPLRHLGSPVLLGTWRVIVWGTRILRIYLYLLGGDWITALTTPSLSPLVLLLKSSVCHHRPRFLPDN